MSTPQLVIRQLSKTYGNGVKALQGVDLEVPNGMFGLLGPNGAGKSSLMRTIATLQDPDAGEIQFRDINVLTEKERLRRVLGYLPQDFGVYPNVDAHTMLHHFATLKGITNGRARKELVDALLNKVNLWAARKKKLGGYSGGMRQRFGIAQALIGDPQLLIVDEPTAGLDPEERNRFLNLLSEIGEQVVVILSTHIVEDVADLCPKMAILAGGTVLYDGVPGDAIGALEGRIWKRIIEREDLPRFQKDHSVLLSRLVAGRTMIHVHDDERPDESFQPVAADLEHVYFTHLNQSRERTEAAPAVAAEAEAPSETEGAAS